METARWPSPPACICLLSCFGDALGCVAGGQQGQLLGSSSSGSAWEQGMVFSWLVTGRHFCLCYQVADIRGRELKCEGVGLKPERSGIALVLWHLQRLQDHRAAALAGLGRCRQSPGMAEGINWTRLLEGKTGETGGTRGCQGKQRNPQSAKQVGCGLPRR